MRGRGIAAMVIGLVAILAIALPSAASAATGPVLAPDSEYAGTLEGRYDQDTYGFYVVAEGLATAHLALASPQPPGIVAVRAAVTNANGVTVGELSAPQPNGAAGEADLSLPTGRYTVSVASAFVGFGESYVLRTGPGTGGAFYPGEEVGYRCSKAQGGVTAAKSHLAQAQRVVKRASTLRAKARRHGSAKAKRRAVVRLRKAKTRVRVDRTVLAEARTGVEPWCGLLG
jgi:hypothetical protein